ncbi:MAG: hypothetical protein VX589_12575 [Myxococcota bacterium]|nr:hypothetical protein [Myxococcota bacterium]
MNSLSTRLQDPLQAHALTMLGLEYIFEQPLSALIDIDDVLESLDQAMDESWTEAWLKTHLRTMIARESSSAQARGDTMADWIAAELQAELRAMAMRPVRFDRDFLEHAVQQDAVRHMLQRIIEETLDRFVNTVKPGGRGGGLLGSVGRGAFGFASRAGRGILGQIGEQLEQQLRGAASLFVKSSTSVMLHRVVELMTHPETERHLGTSRLAAYEGFLAMSTHRLWHHIDESASTDDIISALPAQIAFILGKPEFRARIREEMSAYLTVEGARSLNALLGNPSHVAQIKTNLAANISPLIVGFAASDGFKAWLSEGGRD